MPSPTITSYSFTKHTVYLTSGGCLRGKHLFEGITHKKGIVGVEVQDQIHQGDVFLDSMKM